MDFFSGAVKGALWGLGLGGGFLTLWLFIWDLFNKKLGPMQRELNSINARLDGLKDKLLDIDGKLDRFIP